jgi:hypothetical protein
MPATEYEALEHTEDSSTKKDDAELPRQFDRFRGHRPPHPGERWALSNFGLLYTRDLGEQ